MSTLILVRHGEAVYDERGYGSLSERGVRQARALGAFWAGLEARFDHVFVGPRARHRETEAQVSAAYRDRGLAWPAAGILEGLDEYDAEAVLTHGAPLLLDREPELAGLVRGAGATAGARELGRAFRTVTRSWAVGAFEHPQVESFTAFRRRVAGALDAIAARCGRGARVVAFSSGGPIAAAAGHALRAHDEVVIELSWLHRNTGLTRLLFSDGRFGLESFNALPHLADSEVA